MFVWAGNSGKLLVNKDGRVKDRNKVNVNPQYDTEGYKYVMVERTKYYVHELVIQNHGKPPHQNRLPKKDEKVIFIDGDITNTHISNLKYVEKGKKGTYRTPEGVPEALEEYVWQLLRQGLTYEKIQEKVAQSSYSERSISIGKIAEIRKERSENTDMNELTPAEQQSLNAIKKELGETDDARAKVQKIAKQEAEEKSKKIKEKAAEEEHKALEEQEKHTSSGFEKEHAGGGWYAIKQDGEEITEKRFRKKDAIKIVKQLKEGGKTAQDILEEYQK